MKKTSVMKWATWSTSMLVLTFFAVGCGTANQTQNQIANQTSAAKSQTQNVVRQGNNMLVGAGNYAGQANLHRYETAARNAPGNAQDQINAGISAYDNGKYQTAITYYKKAIQLAPKNAIAYNNLGNAYFRGLKQPKSALPYYQKATQVQPSYAYGWYNLALCQEQLGQKAAARSTLQTALKAVAKTDKLYPTLQTALKNV